jgi:membrane fusion protein (multidrug efflux system)
MQQFIKSFSNFNGLFLATVLVIYLYACNAKASTESMPPSPLALPVLTVQEKPAVTYKEFSASLEGSQDIEIRAQVDGYLDKIFVDEGAYVKKGQNLFAINSRPYTEQLNNAKASLAAAKANLVTAEINVSKLAPLVQTNVVSEIQLKTASAARDAATAAVAQAEAMRQQAEINVGYTLIKAPAEGYITRLPFKTGSLVGVSTVQPLTVLSSSKEIFAYFSMSEKDFLAFENKIPGTTIEAKLKQLSAVELVLADNSIYSEKGKIETVSGQFNNRMGSIPFRASFSNSQGLLRSGNTGKIRIPDNNTGMVVIPQSATFELQDKVFVFVLGDSNKVASTPIQINAKSGNYYLVKKGISAGQKIVYTGLDRLKDGAVIAPEMISLDSLISTNPL